MNPIPNNIEEAIRKFFEGNITPDEKKLLDEWYDSFSQSDVEIFSDESEERFDARMRHRLHSLVKKDRESSQTKVMWMRAAAAVLVVSVSIVAYRALFQQKVGHTYASAHTSAKVQSAPDLDPGVDKAILTLGNGTTVVLDSNSGKSLASDGGINIVKVGDGQVQYQRNAQKQVAPTVFNTISTPRGGQYHIKLTDGTQLWLNASSSVRFPVEFGDSIREVEMTGEAYFEVAHNPSKPFRVKVKDNYIDVLGTHFNVMAYDNESSINTTLLQGSVNVHNGGSSRVISPGQQASVSRLGSIRVINDAAVDEAVAWKNGFFQFKSAGIESIMHQVERWYDAEIKYEGKVELHFTGQVSRSVKISELLRKLELTNDVHFRIEGNRITVLP